MSHRTPQGFDCELCLIRTDAEFTGVNEATRRWYGSTDGELATEDPIEGIFCCTTCYNRVYRRARRRR